MKQTKQIGAGRNVVAKLGGDSELREVSSDMAVSR